MKLLKMFGLAAIAALMTMAFVGAGSAMASTTALCKVDPLLTIVDNGDGKDSGKDKVTLYIEHACPAPSMAEELASPKESPLVSHVHETTLASSQAKLLSSISTVECDVEFLGDVDTAGLLSSVSSSPSTLEINGVFTYENCNNNCTVFEESTPSTIKVLKGSHETGTVTGEGRVHVECGVFIDCIYNGAGLEGTAKGPLLSTETNGSVSLSEQVTNKVGGFGCPTTAKLDITTTPLSATYITK